MTRAYVGVFVGGHVSGESGCNPYNCHHMTLEFLGDVEEIPQKYRDHLGEWVTLVIDAKGEYRGDGILLNEGLRVDFEASSPLIAELYAYHGVRVPHMTTYVNFDSGASPADTTKCEFTDLEKPIILKGKIGYFSKETGVRHK